MITAILDTNDFVQALSSSPQSASSRVLASYFDHRIRLVFSPATFDELIEVLSLPQIRAKHGLSDDEIIEITESLWDHAVVYRTTSITVSAFVRDLTDKKFLALAEESNADYLVTNDRRHLRPLGRHHRTEIVTPAEFLEKLATPA